LGWAWAFLFYFVFKTLHFKNHSKVKKQKNKSQVTDRFTNDFGLKICNNLLSFNKFLKFDLFVLTPARESTNSPLVNLSTLDYF
jgi:hypothetical protein